MLTTAPSRWPRVKAEKCRSIDSIVQQVEVKFYILPRTSSSHKICPSSSTVTVAAFEVRHSIVQHGNSNFRTSKGSMISKRMSEDLLQASKITEIF
jgi:hypothetical protein